MQHLLYKFPNSQLLLQTYTNNFIKESAQNSKLQVSLPEVNT